jgi:ammonia channel protein AmtB
VPVAVGIIAATLTGVVSPALAANKEVVAATVVADAADTCWILICTALVLFMTIPGLSAFYAGLVKRKNSLSVLMQCFSLTCVISVLWFSVGYTLSFSGAGSPFLGGLDKAFLAGVWSAQP